MSLSEITLSHRLNYTRYARLIYTQSTAIVLQSFEWLYIGRPLTLKDYCKKNPEKFKNIPAYDVIAIKDGKKSTDNMDFSMMYKLLQNVCGLANPDSKIWFKKPDKGKEIPLENVLHQLKDLRNEFSHPNPKDFMALSDTDLDNKVEKLRYLFEKVLILSAKKGGVTGRKIKRALSKLEDDLQKERYSKHSLTDKEFLVLSQAELSEQASSGPEKSYLKPRLEEHLTNELNMQNQDNLKAEMLGHIDFKQPRIFPLDDLLDHMTMMKQLPRVIVLSGSTGAGKTSLCRFFSRDWLAKSSSIKRLKKYEMVVFLQCKKIYTRDLHYLLRKQIIKNAAALCDTADLTRLLKSHRILWLVDGWDEATRDAKSLIAELVQDVEEHWISHTLLITSRPQMTGDLVNIIVNKGNTLKVSLLGLDKVEQETLSQMNITNSCGNLSVENFMHFISSCNDSIKEELKNPLKLLLIGRLWVEDPSKIESGNLIHLYAGIKETYTQRLLSRLQDASMTEHDSVQVVSSWLKLLAKIAFESLNEEEGLSLGSHSLRLLQNTCDPMISLQCLSTFLEYYPQLQDGKEVGHSSFVHASQKIFYASLHLENVLTEASDPENEVDRIFQQSVSKFEFGYAIDPFLGTYDILHQVMLIFMTFVSRVSNGAFWAHLQKSRVSSTFKYAVRKSIDILSGTYSEQNIEIPNIGMYYSVFLGVLEMQSFKNCLDKLPINSIMKLIHLSIPVDSISSRWFEVIRACRYNECVLKEVMHYVNTVEWRVGDIHLKAAWELMCHVIPEKIVLVISGNPKNLPDLEILLLLVRTFNIKVELYLNMHLKLAVNDLSDDYLDILCRSNTKCKLTAFGGHLNRQNLHTLSKASHLKSLLVRTMDSEMVKCLCETIYHLRNLQEIKLVYDLTSYPHPSMRLNEVAPLPVLGYLRKLLKVHLFLPHIQITNVKNAVHFMSRFCGNYASIRFRHHGKRGLNKIHSGLHDLQVIVSCLQQEVYFRGLEHPIIINVGHIHVNNHSMMLNIRF